MRLPSASFVLAFAERALTLFWLLALATCLSTLVGIHLCSEGARRLTQALASS